MLVGEILNIMNSKKITNLFICEKNNSYWYYSYSRFIKIEQLN